MKIHNHHDRGAVLLTVLILTTALAIMAGALIAYSTNEHKLNRRGLLRLQAQDATEAELEYAVSQLPAQLTQSSLASNYLSSYPLTPYSSRFAASPANFFSTGSSTNSYVGTGTGSFKLWASQISPAVQQQFSSSSQAQLNGRTVNAHSLFLVAQATATDLLGNSVTSYAREEIEICDLSIFQYAIFYNVPLELHPSFDMDIYGPVFSNKDVYLSVSNGNSLNFHDSFATAGQFSATPLGAGESGNNRPSGPTSRNISFTNSATGNLQSINDDPTITIDGNAIQLDSYVDSSFSQSALTFNTVAPYLWGQDVKDQSFGVQAELPPGIAENTNAHLLIEPPDPTASVDPSDNNYSAAEASKISRQAGLYIVVEPNADTNPNGAIVAAFANYQDALSYEYSDPTNKIKNNAAARSTWLSSNQGKVLFSSTGNATNSLDGIVNTSRLMYDTREGAKINTVDIDMGALKTAIGASGASSTLTSGSATPWLTSTTDTAWNGIVYVDVQTDSADSNPNSGTVNFASGWATTSDVKSGSSYISGTGAETVVRLVDGENLPNRGAANGTSIVTNAPVYVVGNYNSNGTLEGGNSPTDAQVMTPDSAEVPAMVAGDSINILSAAWWSGGKPTGDASVTKSDGSGTGVIQTAADTEIAAAFISGIVATTTSGDTIDSANTGNYTYSGGVENYMRLHEDWSKTNTTVNTANNNSTTGASILRYRGSIVGLYNSEVATQPWPHSGASTYKIPSRQWGFDTTFRTVSPPGAPYARILYRIGYQELAPADFAAMNLNPNKYDPSNPNPVNAAGQPYAAYYLQ